MNKFKKVLCTLIIVCTLLSLSGCYMMYDYMLIDEALESHAKFTDESHKVISYKDKNFLRYDGNSSLEIDDDSSGYITEADVPALLAGQYGDYFYINSNENIISIMDDNKYYIREDCYEELVNSIENGGISYFCYRRITEEYEHILATDDQLKAIEATISGAPINFGSDSDYKYSIDYEIGVLCRCDKTMSIISDSFYICTDSKGNLLLSSDYGTYAVPEQYKLTILEMKEDDLIKTEESFF